LESLSVQVLRVAVMLLAQVFVESELVLKYLLKKIVTLGHLHLLENIVLGNRLTTNGK
jgi:hypothetical protein